MSGRAIPQGAVIRMAVCAWDKFESNIGAPVDIRPPYWGLRDYGVAGQIGLERTPEEGE